MQTVDIHPQETPEASTFCIDSDRAADWLLARYAAIDAEIALVEAQAADVVKRLRSDRERLEYLFGGQLEQYVRQRLAADPAGRRSLILLHGTCQFRTVPASVKVYEPTVALLWAREHRPDLVLTTTREEVDTHAYREIAVAALETTGEILPGCMQSAAKETFTLKFGSK